MIKIISCVLILFSSVALGYLKSKDFEKRQKILTCLKANVIFMENEMMLIRTNVLDIIKKLSKSGGDMRQFYNEVVNQYNKDTESAISEIWKISADKFFKEAPVLKSDIDILCLLGEGLGKSDIEGQQKIFNTVKQELDIKLEEAVNDKNKNSRLYKSLGFYMGVLIIVMFF